MEKTGIAKKLFQGDRSVWFIFMLLCCFSIIEVFSATSALTGRNSNIMEPITRHTIFLLSGFMLTLVLSHTNSKYFTLGILLLPISIILLIFTSIWGIDQNDATRRLELFGTPFQPSEIGKLACIIFVAFILSKREKFSNKKAFKYIMIGVGTVCMLILGDNLSTALILGFVCFIMMYIGQIPWKKLVLLFSVISFLVALSVSVLLVIPQETNKSFLPRRAITWQNRVNAFVDNFKKEDPNGEASKTIQTDIDDYQVVHSKIAISQGSIFGKGPGRSTQREFLPQAFDDFIYAIIIEELGIVGGIVVLLLYLMLTIRAGIIARRCEKLFPKYLVLGCTLLILIQALVNMAVAVNLAPVTGQPLPLISRGGTSIMITCIYFGMILGVSRTNAKMYEKKLNDEEDEDVVSQGQADEGVDTPAEQENIVNHIP